jgi:hypothetical protein
VKVEFPLPATLRFERAGRGPGERTTEYVHISRTIDAAIGPLVQILQDDKMASISNRNALAMAEQPSLRAFPSDLFAILTPQGRW